MNGDDIDRIVFTEQQVADRVVELGAEITARYEKVDEPLTIIPILNGALVFVADLMRRLPIDMRLGIIAVSSYPGQTRESKDAEIKHRLADSVRIRGRRLLIVDDILDSGNTLRLVQGEIAEQEPLSVETAVFLRRLNRNHEGIQVDYIGFDIGEGFAVGYGLDYDERYRNLPHIAVLKPESDG